MGLLSFSACTYTTGSTDTEVYFTYPNSNVEPLGKVKASVSKGGFFSVDLTEEDLIELLDEALAQQQGADNIINYTLTTELTNFVFVPYFTVETTIEGQAVKMEVGEKNVQDIINNTRHFRKETQ
jgi:hypothetical protein